VRDFKKILNNAAWEEIVDEQVVWWELV